MLTKAQKQKRIIAQRLRRRKAKNERIKHQAITDLFNSNMLEEKIKGMLYRYRVPINAEIQNDVLQTVFLELTRYNTDKFVEAYLDNPKRIFALAITIAYRSGFGYDKRTQSGHNKSIAQKILHQSTLNTLQHIDTNADDTDDFNLPQVAIDDIPDEEDHQPFTSDMWQYVKQRLNEEEEGLLNLMLQPEPPKLKGIQKKEFVRLKEQLKTIITFYKTQRRWNRIKES